MAHVQRDRQALLKRTRRLKGQIEAVERALVEGAECDHLLQQLAAVRGAANGLMCEVLEGHVREHVAMRSKSDVDAVLQVVRRYLR